MFLELWSVMTLDYMSYVPFDFFWGWERIKRGGRRLQGYENAYYRPKYPSKLNFPNLQRQCYTQYHTDSTDRANRQPANRATTGTEPVWDCPGSAREVDGVTAKPRNCLLRSIAVAQSDAHAAARRARTSSGKKGCASPGPAHVIVQGLSGHEAFCSAARSQPLPAPMLRKQMADWRGVRHSELW